jgi:deferrochelatase/peroxidase EfeB
MASRRAFLGAGALLGAGAGLAASAGLRQAAAQNTTVDPAVGTLAPVVPFHGPHQGGITTPQQAHTYLAAFDLTTASRDEVKALLAAWTEAAARLTAGQPADPNDSGDTIGMPPARLTLTFGFGPGLFEKDGHDRYGLAARRPPALADLPRFVGDQLQPGRSGGDLSIQACAEDPHTAFHAVRQLARLAYGRADIRWVQSGFIPQPNAQTPRNLMGFRDGSNNPDPANQADMDAVVWAGAEGPAWMAGGSYLVVRRIRIALEHWDRTPVAFQEQTMGRTKSAGAPIGAHAEHDPANFTATDPDGNPIIAENAHVRLAAPANAGARIFRRGYSYNDGASFTAERWPPWRQAMEYDAGLLFLAYQKDPRTQFTRVFDRMAKFDMLNQFTTHTGSGLFAVPPGVAPGQSIGGGLFS